jgi:hypothetical protein
MCWFWRQSTPVPDWEVAEARKLYLARYANSKYWLDFEDFSFYHMKVVDVYYVWAAWDYGLSIGLRI